MGVIGVKFKNNEVFVPEVLVAARAMNMGVQVLKPHLQESGVQSKGRVCIGTVKGDLHDIGKNLVKLMMEGKGLEVIDLGTDVAPETFIRTAVEQECGIICCSALLTTTMGAIGDVVKPRRPVSATRYRSWSAARPLRRPSATRSVRTYTRPMQRRRRTRRSSSANKGQKR